MEGSVIKGKLEFSPETGVFALTDSIEGLTEIGSTLLFLLSIYALRQITAALRRQSQVALDLRVLVEISR